MKLNLGNKPTKPEAKPEPEKQAESSSLNARYEETQKRQSKLNEQLEKSKGSASKGLNSLLKKNPEPEKEPPKKSGLQLKKPSQGKPTTPEPENHASSEPKSGLQLGKKPGLQLGKSKPKSDVSEEVVTSDELVTEPNDPELPAIGDINDKYNIVDEAPEHFDTEVLEQFATRMQALIDTEGTQELQNSLKEILVYTQEHPELKEILRPEDVQLFVRACRQSYGLVVKAKAANQAKKKTSNENLQEIMSDLAEVEFEI